MTVHTLEFDHLRLTRVGYMDLPVPAELIGIDPDAVAALPWASPTWAEGEQPRLGAAAWFIEAGGRRLVYDPLMALDVILRADRDAEQSHQDTVARVFAEAGFAPESIDTVLMSHIDGIGMVARRDPAGHWAPFFPAAQVLLSVAELEGFVAAAPGADAAPDPEREAWMALIDQGCVSTYDDGETIVPGLTSDVSGGHGPGHAVMHIGDDRPAASLIGHLAVAAVQVATGPCAAMNEDPASAWTLLQQTIADGRLLIGPLWPDPGCGRWAAGALQPGA